MTWNLNSTRVWFVSFITLVAVMPLWADDAALLDVFPLSAEAIPQAAIGRTVLSSTYTPNGSSWAEGLDERAVFDLQMTHEQGSHNSFALRLGRGGQIYSLRAAFGESVPPSWRDPNDKASPWNDEVWQFVAVCTRYNGLRKLLADGDVPETVKQRFESSPYASTYFVHNSGAYIPADADVRSLYCPKLAASTTADGRAYRILNWGLVPQVRSMHRSTVLYYTQVRDLGDGVIELTWVVHNFSTREDIVYDHLNAPWGGTRITSLPVQYVSTPRGELAPRETFFEQKQDAAIDVRRTGGWSISAAADNADAPALALVYGLDRHRDEDPDKPHRPSIIRNFRAGWPAYDADHGRWKDWRTRPENSFRNYDVIEMIPRMPIAPQTTVWYRCYLVVNGRDRAADLARSLVEHIDYGQLRFDASTTPMRTVSVRGNEIVVDESGSSRSAFRVYARPVDGSRPLFLILHAETGRSILTTDPYYFVEKEQLDMGVPADHPQHDYYSRAIGYRLDRNHSEWRTLVGFALDERPSTGTWERLSQRVSPSTFPAADRFHRDLWVQVLDSKHVDTDRDD